MVVGPASSSSTFRCHSDPLPLREQASRSLPTQSVSDRVLPTVDEGSRSDDDCSHCSNHGSQDRSQHAIKNLAALCEEDDARASCERQAASVCVANASLRAGRGGGGERARTEGNNAEEEGQGRRRSTRGRCHDDLRVDTTTRTENNVCSLQTLSPDFSAAMLPMANMGGDMAGPRGMVFSLNGGGGFSVKAGAAQVRRNLCRNVLFDTGSQGNSTLLRNNKQFYDYISSLELDNP